MYRPEFYASFSSLNKFSQENDKNFITRICRLATTNVSSVSITPKWYDHFEKKLTQKRHLNRINLIAQKRIRYAKPTRFGRKLSPLRVLANFGENQRRGG